MEIELSMCNKKKEKYYQQQPTNSRAVCMCLIICNIETIESFQKAAMNQEPHPANV